jgi:uncharacterized protein YcgI (DUF1989 family)
MRDLPVEVILRLTPRQLRLLADARDRLAPGLSLESFAARAVAEAGDAPQPYTGVPVPPVGGVAAVPGLVRPGSAAALELQPGESVRIEQAVGGQCVDVVAWSLADARERLSAARTRSLAGSSPGLGDALWSGPPFERPLLAVVADSAPGHDLLFPACSAREYAAAGCAPEPSCAGVQAAAAAGYGLEMADLPDPLNLWLRSAVAPDGALTWRSTGTVRGDHVVLLALRAVLVLVNPCVDDVFGCSGLEPRPIVVRPVPAGRYPLPDRADAPASPVTGVACPLDRVAEVAPAQAIPWHELVVDLPGSPGAAEARAAAVRFSLAVLAGSAA